MAKRTAKQKRTGHIQQKVLLLLVGGLTLGLTRSPRQYFRVAKAMHAAWQEIDRKALGQSVNSMERSGMAKAVRGKHGAYTLALSDEGRRCALNARLNIVAIEKPARWDGRWRIVMFDIPERLGNVRSAFRIRLRKLGFCELQKSVFIFPYYCVKEIDYIARFFNVQKYIRTVTASEINNPFPLKRYFNLL
ncbi:MAG: hypothetical protein AAB938_00685 [Patescibacteria group bacterium]